MGKKKKAGLSGAPPPQKESESRKTVGLPDGAPDFLQPVGKDGEDGVLLFLHIQPKAAKSRVAGVHGDRLKLAVASPPVDGKANTEVVRYVAELFDWPRSKVELKSGHQSRQKSVFIAGLNRIEAVSRLQSIISQA